MRDASGVAAIPLATLLSWAWIAFAIEVDNAVEAAGSERVGRLFRISISMWANGLRFIDDKGIAVDELRTRARLAEGLSPPEGCWRAEKPYLAQTQRVLADPTAALPWHPMVLHRGGWPDGN